jgi:uncharacterized protein YukE
MRVQAMNSLLRDTTSHLKERDVRNHLESGMENVLSKCCTGAKLHDEKDFKKWAHAVKALNELMRAERAEFEQIAKTIRDANR